MSDVMPILSQAAQSILALALPIVAAYLATQIKTFLVVKVAELKSSVNSETAAFIDAAVNIAVLAAEQLGGVGSTKLEYALKWLTDYLDSHGVVIDLGLLRGLIEAEVRRQFPKSK